MTPTDARMADLERQVEALRRITDYVLWPTEQGRARAVELLERMAVEPTAERVSMLVEVYEAAREEGALLERGSDVPKPPKSQLEMFR